MIPSHASLTIAGLGGDSGKTFLSLGLTSAYVARGLTVAPFKKGPDYIDAAWLTLAAGRSCRNLDSFLMTDAALHRTWDGGGLDADLSLMEGNRGLYDGMDVSGQHSTAAIATKLSAPVLLVLDATKVTRTLAAIALGMRQFDPEVPFAGLVLNQVGGERHERVAREAIERYTDLTVYGAIPRLRTGRDLLPGRHLGLLTVDEHPRAREAIDRVRAVVETSVDLDALLEAVRGEGAPPLACLLPWRDAEVIPLETDEGAASVAHSGPGNHAATFAISERGFSPAPAVRETTEVRIGVIRDSAFSFYYPENLEELEDGGGVIVPLDSLNDTVLPQDLDALYIGGGFPETHAEPLARNQAFLTALREGAERGLPLYAECGGLMLLCREIEYDGRVLPMAGVFPFRAVWSKKPVGHGYVRAQVDAVNPFYPVGLKLRGHEFHHSRLVPVGGGAVVGSALAMEKGVGVGQHRDGLTVHNVLALYTHVHAAGTPEWAEGVLQAARTYRHQRLGDLR